MIPFDAVNGMVDAARKYRVLVVDDCRDTVEALAMLLRVFGHEPRTARAGLDAIAIARSFEPEVVLLDLGLPDISGFDVSRELRRSHPHSYVIALSGHVRAVDRERAYQAGFDLHVGKPIGSQALLLLLEVASYAERARVPLASFRPT